MESKDFMDMVDDFPGQIVSEMVSREMVLFDESVTKEYRYYCRRRIQDFIEEVHPKLKEICSNEAHRTFLREFVPMTVKRLWYANIGEENTAFLDHYMKFRCGPEMTEKLATAEQQRMFAEVLGTARAKLNKDIEALRKRLMSIAYGWEPGVTEVVTAEQQKLSAEACGKLKEDMNTSQAEQPVSDQSVNKRPLNVDKAEQPGSDRNSKKPCLDEDMITPAS